MPPFGLTMKIFYKRLYMKRCVFSRFPANFKKMGEFAASIERSKAKSVSASGGLGPPDPPTRNSAPGLRLGLRPQTPVIGSRSARSPCPPLCQILNTPLIAPLFTTPKTVAAEGQGVYKGRSHALPPPPKNVKNRSL